MIFKIKTFFGYWIGKARAHKFIAGVLLIAVAFGGYYAFKKIGSVRAETRYVLAAVAKGTLVSSITGTGQVSASRQIEVKAKGAGDVVAILVASGKEIKAGMLLVQLDARDAAKTVRDAEVNMKSAELALQKLKKPADELSFLQANNAVARAQESKVNAENNLEKAYEDGFNMVANAFLDLPAVMTGLQNILYTSTPSFGGAGVWNIDQYASAVASFSEEASQFKADTNAKYDAARRAYDRNFNDYKSASRLSNKETIDSLISETYDTAKKMADAVKSANNLIQFYKDKLTERNFMPSPIADTHLTSLAAFTGKTNAHLLNLLGAKDAIRNSKDAVVNAGRSIAESEESFMKLKAGADELDMASAELTLEQRRNALFDAREKLSDYFIRAPFDGVVANVNVKKSDTVANGASVATFITKQKIAEISLNEVDVARVKTGNKATLTFDAVPDLSVSGTVIELDIIGTVNQGVVTYNVKIGFDTDDDRIKPGMTVSAAIITDVKLDILMVPAGAVKARDNEHYVQILDAASFPNGSATAANSVGVVSPAPPRAQAVEIGLSNDTVTEIISGLKEGDQVVVRTVNTAASQSQQQAPSLFGSSGGRAGGGGAIRISR